MDHNDFRVVVSYVNGGDHVDYQGPSEGEANRVFEGLVRGTNALSKVNCRPAIIMYGDDVILRQHRPIPTNVE